MSPGATSRTNRPGSNREKCGRGAASVPIFLLVPQVRLRKRLDLARDAKAVLERIPGAIVARWGGAQTLKPARARTPALACCLSEAAKGPRPPLAQPRLRA
jgi:hypothetical protein